MADTAGTRQRTASPLQEETLDKAARALEEEMEEANVTDVRSGLLPMIERIQKNPAIRVIIRKHGKRRAVLMSAATYDTLMEIAHLFTEENDRLSPEEKLEAAYRRMESGSPNEQAGDAGIAYKIHSGSLSGKEVRALVQDAQQILRELDTRLTLGDNY